MPVTTILADTIWGGPCTRPNIPRIFLTSDTSILWNIFDNNFLEVKVKFLIEISRCVQPHCSRRRVGNA